VNPKAKAVIIFTLVSLREPILRSEVSHK